MHIFTLQVNYKTTLSSRDLINGMKKKKEHNLLFCSESLQHSCSNSNVYLQN